MSTVTIAQAAKLLDLTVQEVRALTEDGRLPHGIARGASRVPLKAVVSYAVRRAERNALEIGYVLGQATPDEPHRFVPPEQIGARV